MLSENRMAKMRQAEVLCVEDLVPGNHLLRDMDAVLDFSFIYDLVRPLYCADNGRPSIDPVVLFKIVLIQYTFGIRSMRQTIKEIEVNMAYRWFLGYGMTEPVPHFTTFGKNYLRRFADTDIFEKIFERILLEVVAAGFVDASAVFIDATHIKANANNHKYTNETVRIEAKHDRRSASVPYKRPMTKEGFFKKYEYVYDEYYDCYLCPNDQALKHSTTNREGYREYKSDPKICKNCPRKAQCTESRSCQKVVTRHVWEDYMELAEDVRHSDKGKEIYKLRKETIERVFADAKVKHGLRYTQFRGLARLKMQVLLTFSCMNLKKLASWKRKNGPLPPVLRYFFLFLSDLLFLTKKPHPPIA